MDVRGCLVFVGTLLCCRQAETLSQGIIGGHRSEPTYRLPDDVIPLTYDIFIFPDIYEPNSPSFGTFRGTETIRIRAQTSTNVIILHQAGLRLGTATLTEENGPVIPTSKPLFVERDLMVIPVGQELEEGKVYTLYLGWKGTMRKDALGLYLSSYKTDNGDTVYLASTQMQPTFARSAFPCFDEPRFRSNFSMKIGRRMDVGRNYTSMFNAPLLETRLPNYKGGWAVDIFDYTPQMPSYLVAFVVSDYTALGPDYVDGIRYTTYARPNSIEEADLGHKTGLVALEWLEKNFAPPYYQFLPKIDSVTIPDFDSGAMENWGLVTYNDNFLYLEGRDLIWQPQWVVETVAHELVHQWFGNIVTPDWWDSLWLSEGFATYFMYYIMEDLFPSNKNSEIAVGFKVLGLMDEEAKQDKHPLTYDVMTPEEIKAGFDTIEYQKGGAIVRMMHMIMGEHFFPGLRHYLTKNALRSVKYTDLLEALDEYGKQVGKDFQLSKRMQPWILQSGYPLVLAQRDGAQLTLTQERFRSKENTDWQEGRFADVYDIPIQVISSNRLSASADDIIWFGPSAETGSTYRLVTYLDAVDEQADWIALNPGHQGYYRVNYDPDNWERLSQQLLANPNVFDPLLRATFLDDAFSLAAEEFIELTTALDLTRYLGQELSYPGWSAFGRHSGKILRLLRGKPEGERFENFVRDISGQAASQLGFEISSDFPTVDTFLRTWVAAVACGSGEENCLKAAVDQVDQWMADPVSNPINVNFRWFFYCAAVRSGSAAYYEHMFIAAYNAHLNNHTEERVNLIRAQTCSTDEYILKWTLETALDVRHYLAWNSLDIIDWVADNPVGRDVAFDFLMENLATIEKQVGLEKTMDRVINLFKTFNLDADADRLLVLELSVKELGNPAEWAKTLDSVWETMYSNTEWLQRNHPPISRWLDENGY